VRSGIDRVVVALLLVATLARFANLGERSLWFDEALSGLIARLSTAEVLSNAAGSSHPPGYYFLLHLWRPMGKTEFALRFPSAWFSLLAVALVARLGYDLFGRRTGRLAALGMAVSPFQVYYAQEARMYGLAIALSAGVLWTFLQSVGRDDRGGWWLYVALTALGLYIHYYVALVVLALHLWLLLDRSRIQKTAPALVIADILIALAFLPQLIQFRVEAGEFLGQARWRTVPSPFEPLRTLYYLLFGHALPLGIVAAGLFLILGILAVGIASHRTRNREIEGLLLASVLTPIILVLGISLLISPIYVERSFAVVTPALMVLLARYAGDPIGCSPGPYLGAALAVLMAMGVVLFHVRADPAKPPLEEAIETVTEKAEPTDTILHLQDASYVPALYYDPTTAGALVSAGQRLWLPLGIYPLLEGHTVQPSDLTWSNRAWLISMPGYLGAAQTQLLERFEESQTLVEAWDWQAVSPGGHSYKSLQVHLYMPRPK
jgi:4-amino-4-deoxy-L-arabinose transferase-like glycosyltransferase